MVASTSAPSPLAGEGWGEGVVRLKSSQQFLQDTLNIGEDIIVPESNHSVTQVDQLICSDPILLNAIRMLAAIKFDNQPRHWTVEIDDVIAERHLSPEFPAIQLFVA